MEVCSFCFVEVHLIYRWWGRWGRFWNISLHHRSLRRAWTFSHIQTNWSSQALHPLHVKCFCADWVVWDYIYPHNWNYAQGFDKWENRSMISKYKFGQMHNCALENKNRYVFAYLKSFLAWGMSMKIIFSLHIVGPSHIKMKTKLLSGVQEVSRPVMLKHWRTLTKNYEKITTEKWQFAGWIILKPSKPFCMQGCGQNVRHFSQFRHFNSLRRPECEHQSIFKIFRNIKKDVALDWSPLHQDGDVNWKDSNDALKGSIQYPPDLKCIPPRCISKAVGPGSSTNYHWDQSEQRQSRVVGSCATAAFCVWLKIG